MAMGSMSSSLPKMVFIAPIEEAFYRARVRHPGIATVAVKNSMKRRPARSP
jgi:hypothetical protein